MPVTKAPDWATIKNKPATVAGLGVSDFAAQAIAAQASAAQKGVGSYALLVQSSATTTTIVEGASYAGSGLRDAQLYTTGNMSSGASAPPGTWRAMTANGLTSTYTRAALFVRIA